MHRPTRIPPHGALAAFALAGVLAWSAASAASLTPLAGRTHDAVIGRDLARIDSLGRRVVAAGEGDAWRSARALALLEVARREYLADDASGFDAAAFAEARVLAEARTAGAPRWKGADVPQGAPLAGDRRVREDLWEALGTLVRGDGFDCAAAELARAEVALQCAAHEAATDGACRAQAYERAGEDWLAAAREKAEACRPAAPVAAVETPAPAPALAPSAPVAAPAPLVPTEEELRIPRNVHFALARFDLSARSDSIIAGVVALLHRYPAITVKLVGHTDSRASVAYNLRLSRRRVEVVRDRMCAMGVAAARLATDYRGKSELRTSEASAADFARNRRVEMVLVDPEGHALRAEEQEHDLQLEHARPVRGPARRR